MSFNIRPGVVVLLSNCALLAACSNSGGDGGDVSVPETYVFEREGASTVAYTGQSTRQVLIEDLVGLEFAVPGVVGPWDNEPQ